MKTSISSEVWEQKKALIARLYMEEEWPLKQVIKQIRSDDFNPSETQLRSRLKKWRVTKPSRQVRKKSQQSGLGDTGLEEKVKGPSVSTSPSNHQSSAAARGVATQPKPTGVGIYATPDEQSYPVDGKWNASLIQQSTPSPSWEHAPPPGMNQPVQNLDPHRTSNSFEPPVQTPSVAKNLMLNTTSPLTPVVPAYPLSPESCLPSPGQVTTTPWPLRSVSVDMSINPAMHSGQWYNMPFGPVSGPPNVPQSAPDYRDQMRMACYREVSEPHGVDSKSWNRTMHFPDDRPRTHEVFEQHHRKNLSPPALSPSGVMPLSSTQVVGAQSMVCAPIMPYMGHDSMVQELPGLGY